MLILQFPSRSLHRETQLQQVDQHPQIVERVVDVQLDVRHDLAVAVGKDEAVRLHRPLSI
jgi:hypothetical protein